MPAAESQAVQVAWLQESTYGTNPGTAPYLLNFARQTMRDSPNYGRSNLIAASPDVVDHVRLGIQGAGSVSTELQYDTSGALFQMFRSALRQTAATAATTQVTGVSCTSKVLSAASIETGIEVDDLVRVRNSSDVLLGVYPVTVVGSGSITVGGAALADGTGYKVLRGIRVKRGTARPSGHLEVGRTDIPIYSIYPGQGVDGFSLRVEDQAPAVPIEFSIVGKVTSSRSGTPMYGSAYTAGPTTAVYDALTVQQITIGTVTYAYKSLSISTTNNLRARTQVGAEGPQSLGWGSFEMTGQAQLYLDSAAELNNLRNNTKKSVLMALADSSANIVAMHAPRITYLSGSEDTTGPDTDEFINLSFGASKSSAGDASFRMLWFPA